MIGDKVIIEEIHIKKAEIVLKPLLKKYKPKMLAGIGAISGCGKTEIALVLQEKLWEDHSIRTKIIHLDDYYKIPPISREKHRRETDVIGREEIDWIKLQGIIKSYRENKKYIRVQRIHKYLDDYEFCITPSKDIDIILVEGLFSLYIQELDYKVYLDGSAEDTWEFRVKRGKEDENDEFRKYIVKREANSVVQSKKYADLVIPFKIEEEKK